MGMLGAMTLIASLLAAPVQVSFSPPMVRVGETVPIQLQWADSVPADAQLQWTASAGEVVESSPGAYDYVPPDTPGRAFVHLAVLTPGGLWAESAATVLVYRQFIILKADDLVHVPDDGWARWVHYMDEMVMQRGLKVAVGAIGQRMSLPTEEIRAQVKAWNATGVAEFFNHGYDHASYAPPPTKTALPPGTTYEFQGRPYDEQLAHLLRTQQIIRDNYGVNIRAFGAPFNKWDANTVLALTAMGGQIDIWFFGSFDTALFDLPRGGGELENGDGVPSLDVYLQTHDPVRRLVVLQHHPYSGQFWNGWDGFVQTLDHIAADGATLILPGEYVDLLRKGILPSERKRLFPDAALECAVRMALGKWQGELTAEDAAAVTRLEWVDRLPKVQSLAGLEHCRALREVDLRGNDLPDITPILALWQANAADMTVHWEGNPIAKSFVCEDVPRYEARGLRLFVTGPCDNVLLTLRVEGQGTLDPSPGEHVVARDSEVTLKAKPAEGWEVAAWDGVADAPPTEQLTVKMPAFQTITARFTELPPVPPEGEVTVEGEGETPTEGEVVVPTEGETPQEGEVTDPTGGGCHVQTCPADGSGPALWFGDIICWFGALAGITAYSSRK